MQKFAGFCRQIMLLPWVLLCALQLFLNNIYGNSGDMDVMNDNWKAECIYDFYIVVDVKSIGILHRDEAIFKHVDFFKSISNNGISYSVFEFPPKNMSQLMSIIISWKSMGIRHILFFQKIDTKLLSLWFQILEEICDETWWLFYAEETFHNMFQKLILKRRCLTKHWIVFSSNCSIYEECNEASQKDCYKESSLNSSKAFYADYQASKNIYLEDEQSIMKLAVNESPPYLTLNKGINNTVTLDKGPDAEILRMIAEKLGFKYEINISPDGEWGRIKNRTWTGLMGMLTRGEADIAAGCISMTYSRYRASKFSVPYDVQRSVIISKNPSVKSKTYAVLQPFGYDVWLMLFFVLIIFLFLLYGFGKAYRRFYSRKIYKLDRIFWYMIGTICSEGGWLTFKIQGYATVLLLGLWLLFVIIMQASYSGTLMSVLTFPIYEHAIDSLHDLARAVMKDGYKCGCLKGTINCDTLLDLGDDLLIIKESLNSDKKNFVHSVREGLNKVLEGKYVFVAQQIASVYEAQLMPEPDFYMSDESLDIEIFSLVVRKDFPYLKDINNMILRLFEAGLIAKWRDDVISLNNMQFAKRKREVQDIYPLSLEQLTGAIYMFGYGMLFGMIALIFECVKNKCFNK